MYDYKGPDNKYYCINEIEDSYANFVNTSTITHATLGLYNGLYASICEFVIGVCCPKFAVMIDLIKLITFQMDPMEYGTFILSCLKLDDEYKIISELAGIALTAASDALGLQLVKFVSVIKLYLLVLTRMFMQNIFSVQIIELKK